MRVTQATTAAQALHTRRWAATYRAITSLTHAAPAM